MTTTRVMSRAPMGCERGEARERIPDGWLEVADRTLRRCVPLIDQHLDRCERPGCCDRVTAGLGGRFIEVRVAERTADRGLLVGVAELQGADDEEGSLAFPQVVEAALARAPGITEDAEHVVAQLERGADRVTVGVQRRLELGG